MYALIDTYWAAVKCILCYLKSMIFIGLHITHSSSFALHSFTDADWLVVLMIVSLQVTIFFSLVIP
jgi:hypothetical protein